MKMKAIVTNKIVKSLKQIVVTKEINILNLIIIKNTIITIYISAKENSLQ